MLREILEQNEDEESLREAIRTRRDDLIPKHIIIDDIFATINYMCGLMPGRRHHGRYRPPGQPPHPFGW